MRNFIEFIVGRFLVKNGWEVFAVARSEIPKTKSFVSDGIKIFTTLNPIAAFFHIIKILLFKKPDVIHIFNQRNNPWGIMTAIINKIFRIPLAFTEYGLLHDHYIVSDRDNPFPLSQKFNKNGAILRLSGIFRDKNIKKNIKNYLFHLPLITADKIVFISKHNIEIAEEMGLKNVIYLPHIFDDERWINQEIYLISKKEAISDLEKHKNKNLILFIGQMKLRKGWDVILEAMACLNKDVNAKLIFVTQSEKEPEELSHKINELGIKNKVIFLGRVDGEELKKIYQISKLVVLPSRYEGFGLATIEAWEMQKPVVASDVIAINEHAKNNYNALLVPPENPKALAEAIEKIIKDEQLCAKLIHGGNETLKTLKSPEARNQWLQFYKNLIKNKKAA
jgi:glycosyltransferase involved in cell wall biosynthesis